MQVHDLAKLLHRAHQLALNAARPLREQRDFSRVDWDAWWQMNADMPLSGPGFVKLWTDCATEVFSAIATEPSAPEGRQEAVAWHIEWQFKRTRPDVRYPGGGSKVLWGQSASPEAATTEVARLKAIDTVDWVRCTPLYTRPAEQASTEWPRGTRIRVEHDGFEGVTLGPYVTLEGKRGQVCQLVGAQVVHVYGEKWLQRMGEIAEETSDA